MPAEPAGQVEATDEHARARLQELAYQQGRRDADVDARLLSHERHLNRLDSAVEAFDRKLDKLIAAHKADDAVAADRERRSTTGLTRVQTWALCIGVPVGFLAAVLAPFIAHWLH